MSVATTGVVTLKIDGKDVSADAGETILDAAREAGIDIPTLCFLEGLGAIGACRLCLVEVKGVSKLLPACVTKVAEGMEVTTVTERLTKYRRTVVEMLLAERNHICSVCVSNGNCELQNLCQRLGITHVNVPYRYPRVPFDASHDLFRLDHNRCVLCARCVRVCDEIEGVHTWDMANRGIETRVVIDLNQSWGSSETCTTCGKCVTVCPTGALSRKGTGVAEMEKQPEKLPQLRLPRRSGHGG